MSKTVRFKLSGKEETYAFSRMHIFRNMGVLPPSADLHSLAKEALLLTLQDIENKVREELIRRQEEAANAGSGVGATEEPTAELTDSERADASHSAEEESQGDAAPEDGGNELADRDGGE